MAILINKLDTTPSFVSAIERDIDSVVTHNGIFHPDEVIATAIVSIFSNNTISVVRTRDSGVIESAIESPNVVVLDVGGKFDPFKSAYDHHQRDFNHTRDNGTPYSSAGLAWTYLSCVPSELYLYADSEIFQPVDCLDNGKEIDPTKQAFADQFTYMISEFNLRWNEDQTPELIDMAFERAVVFARRVLVNRLESKWAGLLAKDEVAKFYDASEDKRIVVMPKFVPWQKTIVQYPEPVFIVFPDITGKGWRVQTVPVEEQSFKARKDLPSAWAGLNGKDLDAVSGVDDCIFCHKGLFIAGNMTLEGTMRLAKLALFE